MNICYQKQCKRVSFSPHSLWHLLFVDSLMMTILSSVSWYFTVALICISLIVSDVEHLFMCLLANSVSYLGKCLFRSSVYFLIGLFVFLIFTCMSCLYILEINSLSVATFAYIFTYSVCCLFTLLVSFVVQNLLNLNRPCLFLLLFSLLSERASKRSLCDLCWRVFHLCFL